MLSDLRALEEALTGLLEASRRAKALKAKAKVERELQKAMASAFKAQGAVTVKRLKALGNPQPISEAIGDDWGDWFSFWDAVAAETARRFERPIQRAISKALKLGADAVDMDKAFSLKNPRAEAWLKDRAAERVAMINETTRDSIGSIVKKGIAEGHSYNRMAKAITERFGEFAVGKPQKHIQSRAHLIAITEVGEAYAEGNLQAGQELQAAGLTMEKSWLDSGDGRVSPGCKGNAAAGWIPLDDAFPSGHQRPLRFPGCRCDILIQRKRK